MASNYYTLVAGLREYQPDAENKGFDAAAIISDIKSGVSRTDSNRIDLFYGFYDISNIINLRAGRSGFSELGNFDRQELEEALKNTTLLPEFIARVIDAYDDPENGDDDIDTSEPFEKTLFEAYYSKCSNSPIRFIRQWYDFDRNLRNISAAFTARRLGIPAADSLVGDDYVTHTIARSSAADFGLKGELPYIDDVMAAVSDEGNLLEKERKIDNIRWNMSDELTVFDYFDLNRILAYLVKINIIHRWMSLDEAYGREMFRRLTESLGAEQRETIRIRN